MAIFNMVGGGGSLSATDAILRVIAPAGSVVTISKGAVSKSDQGHENAADHTLYDYYFIIHASQFDSVNPWTVTATLGTQSISNTIVIDSADEYDMVLSYTLWLVYNGSPQAGNFTAVGKRYSDGTASLVAPTVTYQSSYVQIATAASSGLGSGIAYIPSSIDLSKYKSLHLTGSAMNSMSTMANLQIDAWSEIGTYLDNNMILSQDLLSASSSSYKSIDLNIDISNISTNGYVGFILYKGSSGSTGVRITDLYLEV